MSEPLSQAELVAWAEHATAAKDVGGPRRRHARELDTLRAENASLRAENDRLGVRLAAARDGREAALEGYVAVRGAAFASKQQSQTGLEGC